MVLAVLTLPVLLLRLFRQVWLISRHHPIHRSTNSLCPCWLQWKDDKFSCTYEMKQQHEGFQINTHSDPFCTPHSMTFSGGETTEVAWDSIQQFLHKYSVVGLFIGHKLRSYIADPITTLSFPLSVFTFL
jgi:hypothetical protein